MKRVAVCISGVIREPESCIPYMSEFFNRIRVGADVDFFIYTSETTQTGFIPQKSKYLKTRKDDFHESNTSDYDGNHVFKFKDDEIKNYINSFKPKKYVIDDERAKLKALVKEHLPEQYNNFEFHFFRQINQYFVGEECNKLKQKYEQENNFKYDVVFRVRPDLFISWVDHHAPENNKKWWDYFLRTGDWELRGRDNQIHVSYIDVLQGQLRIGDNYYYGSSEAIDNFFENITVNSLLYLKSKKGVIPGYCDEPHPEAVWGNQLITTKSTATTHSNGHFKHEIMRCPMNYISSTGEAKDTLKKLTDRMWHEHRSNELAKKKQELAKLVENSDKNKDIIERLNHQIKELTHDLRVLH
jgi:hypothetical protein